MPMGVQKTGHAWSYGALQHLIASKFLKTEALATGGGIHFFGLAILQYADLNHILAQHVIEGPGDHILQRMTGRGGWAGNAAHASDRPVRVDLPYSFTQSDIAQTRGKSHAIQQRYAAIQSPAVQRFSVTRQAHADRDLQAFRLIRVRTAVVLLQDIHHIEAGTDGGLDGFVAAPPVGQSDNAYIVLLHQSPNSAGIIDVQKMGGDLFACDPV